MFYSYVKLVSPFLVSGLVLHLSLVSACSLFVRKSKDENLEKLPLVFHWHNEGARAGWQSSEFLFE